MAAVALLQSAALSSTSPEAPSAALPPGRRIAEYEIVRVLGAGGFGITYLAFDHQLDGPVALKEYFPAQLATRVGGERVAATATTNQETFAWGLERFLDEARAIHRLRHPNVVRAHRYLEANGTAYIVMEYVEGESLKALLDRRSTLPPGEWRPWLEALTDGLAHVHGHGYLHRDIKPANIVVRAEDGEPVLIDFGAARVQHGDRTHTQVLTAGYAPIEQYSTGASQGPPADIYALAAVSYRVLTGDAVPSAPDRMLNDDCQPLAERMGEADGDWLTAIDNGLAVRPEHRPQDVGTWRRSLSSATGPPAAETAAADSVPKTPPPETPGQSARTGAGTTSRSDRGGSSYFTRGSQATEVIRLQGTPISLSHLEPGIDLWGYAGCDCVYVSPRTHEVLGWQNLSGQLKVRLPPGNNGTDGDHFTRGSHEDDVIRLQGTPITLGRDLRRGEEIWLYGEREESYHTPPDCITISTRTQEVLDWQNETGQLKVRLLPGNNGTGADYFTRGSHADDLIRLQGTPICLYRHGKNFPDIWHYGLGTVQVSSRSQKVLAWNNPNGQLKVRLLPGSNGTDADYFTYGSHADDVIRLQGTPTRIKLEHPGIQPGFETWLYGEDDSVTISGRTSEVLHWTNRSGQLKARLPPESSETDAEHFTRGSDSDDVLRLQGPPNRTNRDRDSELGPVTWFYNDDDNEYSDSVTISTRTSEVLHWTNSHGLLKVCRPRRSSWPAAVTVLAGLLVVGLAVGLRACQGL